MSCVLCPVWLSASERFRFLPCYRHYSQTPPPSRTGTVALHFQQPYSQAGRWSIWRLWSWTRSCGPGPQLYDYNCRGAFSRDNFPNVQLSTVGEGNYSLSRWADEDGEIVLDRYFEKLFQIILILVSRVQWSHPASYSDCSHTSRDSKSPPVFQRKFNLTY